MSRYYPLSLTSTVAALLSATCVAAQTFTLSTAFEGSTFFDGFKYNASVIDNSTGGNIHYVGATANLTYVNDAGNAIVKVDNITSGIGDSTFGRNSVKLISNTSFEIGSLFIIDAVHLPYGCSVWPAIWTLSQQWQTDVGGEIDIWEGVNQQTAAQYTLHTQDGCTQSNNSALPYSGQVLSTDCFLGTNGNQGCAFSEKKEASYGAAFAQNGGGVFATLWDANGVQTWFFPRPSIPADITAGNPVPSRWGSPSASWPAPTCDMSTYFTPQNLIISQTLCGSWAGVPSVFAQTCSGLCTDYIADPANFDTAYFELVSIMVFSGGLTTSNVTAATQVTTSATSADSSSKVPQASAAGSHNIRAVVGFALLALAAAVLPLA